MPTATEGVHDGEGREGQGEERDREREGERQRGIEEGRATEGEGEIAKEEDVERSFVSGLVLVSSVCRGMIIGLCAACV